jgi:AraC family transcriptional regulator, transcriptional activator FtrA
MIDIVRDNPANPPGRSRRSGSESGRHRVAGRKPHRVGLVVYDGLATFELGVACDVFGGTPVETGGVPWYQLALCGAARAPVTVDVGFQMQPTFGLERLRRVDTVVVPPTDCVEGVPGEVFAELRRAHARGCRIISLCTGAFVLAEAGLLDGRRATTHWSECDDLARNYPGITVDPGVLYVDEGDILTAAGSAASIDLCLHVVRQDFGAEIATRLAREMVVPPQRDGGQAQYIDAPMPVLESSNLFADTLAWAQEHLSEPLSVDDLATRSAMSPRTFARRFLAVNGTTPHQWLQRQRVRLAQRLLEMSDLPIEAVAQSSGFCTAGNLRKHFSRTMHTSPQAYRRTFQDRHEA